MPWPLALWRGATGEANLAGGRLRRGAGLGLSGQPLTLQAGFPRARPGRITSGSALFTSGAGPARPGPGKAGKGIRKPLRPQLLKAGWKGPRERGSNQAALATEATHGRQQATATSASCPGERAGDAPSQAKGTGVQVQPDQAHAVTCRAAGGPAAISEESRPARPSE